MSACRLMMPCRIAMHLHAEQFNECLYADSWCLVELRCTCAQSNSMIVCMQAHGALQNCDAKL